MKIYNIVKNNKLFEILLIILIICYFFIRYFLLKYTSLNLENLENIKKIEREGFEWSQYEKDQFILVQHINNPKIVYDLEKIQKHASKVEVDTFLQTGLWPWSNATKELYIEALERNPYVRIYKTSGLNNARKIYNESAILFILKNQTKNENLEKRNNKSDENEENEKNGFGDYGYRPTIIS